MRNVYLLLSWCLPPYNSIHWGFPGSTSGKEPVCQCRRCKRCGYDPRIGTIPWRRAWQPTPVFLPGKLHGQRSLGATVHGLQRVPHEVTLHAHVLLSHYCGRSGCGDITQVMPNPGEDLAWFWSSIEEVHGWASAAIPWNIYRVLLACTFSWREFP